MSASKVARRYSKALVGLCNKDKSHELVAKDLDSVSKALHDNPTVADALASPTVDLGVKARVLEEISKNLALRPLTKSFLLYVNERGRTVEIPGITEDFKSRLDGLSGRIRAVVTSATPLSVLDATRLKAALERASKKKVLVETQVDASLIGGLVTRIDNLVLDGSVKSELKRLRAELMDVIH